MKSTLVINPKGGSGKTTIAINLAACFAAENIPTTLMDYDPQASSLTWLRSRGPNAPTIYAANGAPEKYGRLRSFEMFVPPLTQQLVIDAPAGASGLLLQEMVERAHSVVVPVVPSIIDIRATENFIKDLMGAARVRSGGARVGIVANKVRVSMWASSRWTPARPRSSAGSSCRSWTGCATPMQCASPASMAPARKYSWSAAWRSRGLVLRRAGAVQQKRLLDLR